MCSEFTYISLKHTANPTHLCHNPQADMTVYGLRYRTQNGRSHVFLPFAYG